jgi:hypothetical protein
MPLHLLMGDLVGHLTLPRIEVVSRFDDRLARRTARITRVHILLPERLRAPARQQQDGDKRNGE